MQNPSQISEKKIYEAFTQLHKDRTILRVFFLGKNFETLTIVTGVDFSNETPYFLIDYPGGDSQVIQNAQGGRVFFEYSGEDKLQYSFRTVIHRIREDKIWVKFPAAIERIQRRKFFRVSPPMGTKLIFYLEDREYTFTVNNISENGALVNLEKKYHDKHLFYRGATIRNLYLICEEDFLETQIKIDVAEIKRFNTNLESGRAYYGFHFQDLSKKIIMDLKTFVYDCQREVLKRRSDIGIE